jgi:hypothetical protein
LILWVIFINLFVKYLRYTRSTPFSCPAGSIPSVLLFVTAGASLALAPLSRPERIPDALEPVRNADALCRRFIDPEKTRSRCPARARNVIRSGRCSRAPGRPAGRRSAFVFDRSGRAASKTVTENVAPGMRMQIPFVSRSDIKYPIPLVHVPESDRVLHRTVVPKPRTPTAHPVHDSVRSDDDNTPELEFLDQKLNGVRPRTSMRIRPRGHKKESPFSDLSPFVRLKRPESSQILIRDLSALDGLERVSFLVGEDMPEE